jgi:asparagine synthase (glutamine-hydrolysing)
MCGFLFVYNNKYDHKELNASLAHMNHRGPDAQNWLLHDGHYFGHNRLSIIDLNSRSDQPFVKDKYSIIFNGEVYNYKELIKDHRLIVETKSDTEVILEMYRKYGNECLKYFNGMFTIVIYNTSTKSVFIARDRLGIKPLYIRLTGDMIEVASEISALLALREEQIDDFGVRQYKKLRMTIHGSTLYDNIKIFPPASYFDGDKYVKYWEYSIDRKQPPSDEELSDLIYDAIRLRKRSDVELGSYLSGGLDSTLLSCILNPSHTWTVGFNDMNEFKWAQEVATQLDCEHHEHVSNYDSFLKDAKMMIGKRREPLSVPNEILIYQMTKMVKEKNTVVLSGEGADELFWGYDRIFRWANNASKFDIEEFDELYCYGSHRDMEVLEFALAGIEYSAPLDKVAYFFQLHHLHGLLRRLDNSTMLNSVEARVPFVDHRLVEMLAGVAFEWKNDGGVKGPLKRIFKNIVPLSILNRKKVGFPVPLKNIFMNSTYSGTDMDKWLQFNVENLFEVNDGRS